MRTIKFRGKRIKDGKWIYGNIANKQTDILKMKIKSK